MKTSERIRLIIELNDHFSKNGFAQYKMIDIAKLLNISRAKLYQYFSSKEDIVSSICERYFLYVRENPIPLNFDKRQFYENFELVSLNAMMLSGSATDRFLSDLRKDFTQLASTLTAVLTSYQRSAQAFYEIAKQKKWLREDLNVEVLMLNDESFVMRLLMIKNKDEIYKLTTAYRVMRRHLAFSDATVNRLELTQADRLFDKIIPKV